MTKNSLAADTLTDSLQAAVVKGIPLEVEGELRRMVAEFSTENLIDVLSAISGNGDTIINNVIKISEEALQILTKDRRHLDVARLMMVANEEGDTVLHATMKYRSDQVLPLLNLLLPEQVKALVKRKNSRNETVLHTAVSKGLLEQIKSILELLNPRDRFDVLKVRDNTSRTVTHTAALTGQYILYQENVKSQLSQENWEQLVAEKTKEGSTALHLLVQHGQLEQVESLLSSAENDEAAIDLLISKAEGDLTALHAAASRGQDEIVLCLVKKQLNCMKDLTDRCCYEKAKHTLINFEDEHCCNVLHYLIKMGDYDGVHDYLLLLRWKDRKKQMKSTCVKNMKVCNRRIQRLLVWTGDQHYGENVYYFPSAPMVILASMFTDRKGADKELDVMKRAFTYRFGSTPTELINPSAQDLLDVTEKEIKERATAPSGLIIVLMCHGYEGVVTLRDRQIMRLQTLLDSMCRPPVLDGKPKVLIVQACREKCDEEVRGLLSRMTQYLDHLNQLPHKVILNDVRRFTVGKGNFVTPHGNDVAVVYSNLSGQTSKRRYFLLKLAEKMAKGLLLDLTRIVYKVAEEMAEADEKDGIQINSTFCRSLELKAFGWLIRCSRFWRNSL